MSIRNSGGTLLTTLTAAPGTETALTATATYSHLPLKADPEVFTWTMTGDIGTISADGTFRAINPGTGTITVSAGGQSASISVTVSKLALKAAEDFETAFSQRGGSGAVLSRNTSMEQVRLGRASGKLAYDVSTDMASVPVSYAIPANYSVLTLWVCGDSSGNVLGVQTTDGSGGVTSTDAVTLDFTGWRQVSVALPAGATVISGLCVYGIGGYLNENGEFVYDSAVVPTGTVYLDQLMLSFGTVVDNDVPAVTLIPDVESGQLTGTVSDAEDGVLPLSAVSVTWDGQKQDFTYNAETGILSTSLVSDGRPHRITVTAKDASGNIGRASYDVPVAEDYQPVFTDTEGYWGADYVEFLYDCGVTNGYSDGTFRPNQNITRAQFSVMLFRYLGLEESKYADVVLPFVDADQIEEYAVPAVKALYTEGVINGSTGKDGKLYFNPQSPLTRAQAAAMIGRTQEKGYATAELAFTDAGKIPAYATFYIQTMAAQGILGGYPDGNFRPNDNITRGQMAKVLYNLV